MSTLPGDGLEALRRRARFHLVPVERSFEALSTLAGQGEGFTNNITLDSAFSFAAKMLLGLGLVFEVLGGHQHGSARQPVDQALVARGARRRLGTLAAPRLRLDLQRLKTHLQLLAHRAAMDLPVTGLPLQLVVDMHSPQRSRQLGSLRGQQMQQHMGIDTAAIGDPVGRRRWQSGQ